MLIRFEVKNLFSFKEQTEFNLLPGNIKRLNHHKYSRNGIEILKLSALYGANGSGKSNLIKSIALLKFLLLNGKIPPEHQFQKFKLSDSNFSEPIELAIEFFTNDKLYYYSISINNGIIINEYFSFDSNNQEDKVIFQRKYENKKSKISFFDDFEKVIENTTLKNIIENDLLKNHEPLFTLLNSISNESFIDIKNAYNWFKKKLTIIFPETKARNLILEFVSNNAFKEFAKEAILSFNTGISDISIETKSIEDFFGNDNQKEIDEIKMRFQNSTNESIAITATSNSSEGEIAIINENGEITAKRMLFEHKDDLNRNVEFKFEEESDGTKRLIEYLPALNSLVNDSTTFIIDEIERSIHPLIIKEIIEKFSKDELTKGQLIFSTHESNLLDQKILRTDEIWFAEKDILGSTKFYSLNDFKEHHTIDINKGYLNGRYGAIPFLGNLQDLNWHKSNYEKE